MLRKLASRAHESSAFMSPWGAFGSPSIRGAAHQRPKHTQQLRSSIIRVCWKSKTVRGPRSSASTNPCVRGALSLALQESLGHLIVHEHLGSGAQVPEAHESLWHFRGPQPPKSHEVRASTNA